MTMGAVQDSLVRSHYRFLFRLKKKKKANKQFVLALKVRIKKRTRLLKLTKSAKQSCSAAT